MKKNTFLVFSVGLLSLAVLFMASEALGQRSGTWVPPTQQFPQGNTTPPVDVGGADQIKAGGFDARTLESTTEGSGDAGIKLKPDTLIVSGNNSIRLSGFNGASYFNIANHILFNSLGGSLLLNAPTGQVNASLSKGFVLPNYSTTVLGTGVPVGTITYYNGDIWLFTGGTNCNQQQPEAFIPPANAQEGNCWVKVGGSTTQSTSTTIISTGGPWTKTGSIVYTTGTVVAIGSQNGPSIQIENNGIQLKVPTGSQQSQNTLFPQANAQTSYLTGLSIDPTTGFVRIPTALIFEGGALDYGVKINSGTVEFSNVIGKKTFALGQDGAVIMTKDVRTYENKLAYLGNLSSAGNSYEWKGSQTQTPSTPYNNKCACDIDPNALECTAAPASAPLGTKCYDVYKQWNQPGISKAEDNKKLSFGIEEAKAEYINTYGLFEVVASNAAEIQIGGSVGAVNRSGLINLSDGTGFTTLRAESGALKIAAGSAEVKIKPSNLTPANCVNKYMTVDGSGNLVCQAVPTTQLDGSRFTTFTYACPNGTMTCPGWENTLMGDTGKFNFCFVSGYNINGNGLDYSTGLKCETYYQGGNWYRNAAKMYDAKGDVFCKFTCLNK
ncbi:MAG: hypothetical protein JXB42_03320 [Deltaproteobacteria bacterium]|nr:hypothetical protein [Deltaproteobacteria bacterium]